MTTPTRRTFSHEDHLPQQVPQIPKEAVHHHHVQKAVVVQPFQNMAVSAIAPCIAAIFTNPFDTAKVRLQLQGENIGTTAVGREQAKVLREYIWTLFINSLYLIVDITRTTPYNVVILLYTCSLY